MKRSPKLRPSAWDGIIVVLVLLAAVAGFATWGGSGSTDDLTVVVTVDGTETERIALTDFPDEPISFSANGYTLYLSLDVVTYPDTAGICVSASDCPTQDCVHTGTVTRGGQSIVCLPARIIVTLEGASPDDGGPDLIVG